MFVRNMRRSLDMQRKEARVALGRQAKKDRSRPITRRWVRVQSEGREKGGGSHRTPCPRDNNMTLPETTKKIGEHRVEEKRATKEPANSPGKGNLKHAREENVWGLCDVKKSRILHEGALDQKRGKSHGPLMSRKCHRISGFK